jgi:BlaI family penicillinase repressor
MRLSDSEWQLMHALWKKYPATAREVIEQIPGDVKWAYTTVKTMLNRLVTKKAVAERKRANTSVYEPLVSQNKAQHSALASLYDKVLGGTVEPLMHFLAEPKRISDKERKELIRMLQEMDQEMENTKNE